MITLYTSNLCQCLPIIFNFAQYLFVLNYEILWSRFITYPFSVKAKVLRRHFSLIQISILNLPLYKIKNSNYFQTPQFFPAVLILAKRCVPIIISFDFIKFPREKSQTIFQFLLRLMSPTVTRISEVSPGRQAKHQLTGRIYDPLEAHLLQRCVNQVTVEL